MDLLSSSKMQMMHDKEMHDHKLSCSRVVAAKDKAMTELEEENKRLRWTIESMREYKVHVEKHGVMRYDDSGSGSDDGKQSSLPPASMESRASSSPASEESASSTTSSVFPTMPLPKDPRRQSRKPLRRFRLHQSPQVGPSICPKKQRQTADRSSVESDEEFEFEG